MNVFWNHPFCVLIVCYCFICFVLFSFFNGRICLLLQVYNWAPEPNDGKDYVELSCKFEQGSSVSYPCLNFQKVCAQ